MEKKLYKNSDKKMISGVLAGFADYFNIDVTLLRIGYVVLSLIADGFPGLILYIILAIVMPDISDKDRAENTQRRSDNYKSYGNDQSQKTEYRDVEYKENPKPEDIQTNYKQSGGTYVPKDKN